MVIIGIDPGSRTTGYGVIEARGNRYRCLAYGGIAAVRPGGSQLFHDRLSTIYTELRHIFAQYPPDVIAVEDVFYAVNVKSALKLGQTRGVVLLAAAQTEVPLFEYSALEVKKAVVGYGRAEKVQIQLMVRRLLNMKQQPEPHDAADALAIALCHAFNGSPVRHTRQRWSDPR